MALPGLGFGQLAGMTSSPPQPMLAAAINTELFRTMHPNLINQSIPSAQSYPAAFNADFINQLFPGASTSGAATMHPDVINRVIPGPYSTATISAPIVPYAGPSGSGPNTIADLPRSAPIVPYAGPSGSGPDTLADLPRSSAPIVPYAESSNRPSMAPITNPAQPYNSNNLMAVYGGIKNILGSNPQASQKLGGTNDLDKLSLLLLAKNYYNNSGQQPVAQQPITMPAPQQRAVIKSNPVQPWLKSSPYAFSTGK
jgi:hypothetical protein